MKRTIPADPVSMNRLSEILGMSRHVLARWCKLGKLTPAVLVSGTVRFSMEAVMKEIAAETQRNIDQKAHKGNLARYLSK